MVEERWESPEEVLTIFVSLAINEPRPSHNFSLTVEVANGDVAKAAAVTDAVARELDCMRKDVGSINLYCSDCEKKSKSLSLHTIQHLVERCTSRSSILCELDRGAHTLCRLSTYAYRPELPSVFNEL